MGMFIRLCRLFENRVQPFTATRESSPSKRFLSFVGYFFQGSQRWLLLLIGMTALVAACELLIFYGMGKVVDWLAASKPQTLIAEYGDGLATVAVLAVCVLPIMLLLHTLVLRQVLHDNLPIKFRWLAFFRLIQQDVAFFQRYNSAQLAQKLSQTAIAMRNLMVQVSQTFTYVVSYFFGMCISAVSTHPLLLLPIVAWGGAYLVIIRLFIPKLRIISAHQADAAAQVTGVMGDVFFNIQTMKIYSTPQAQGQYLKSHLGAYKDIAHQQSRIASQLYFSLQVINALLLFFISVVAIYAWCRSAISVGGVAIMISLALRLRAISQSVLWEISACLENIGTVEDAIPLLTQNPLVIDPDSPCEVPDVTGRIDYVNVSFGYLPSQLILRDLTLHIASGEKVGIVGRSGSGKSTLINLLLRFYDPQQGAIYVDGIDLKTIAQSSLRGHISVVNQDAALLHRSIRDNLSDHAHLIDEQRFASALSHARADEFLGRLEDGEGRRGYDYVVGERGGKLSGGQRQRLAIARALLKNAPIFVLDEATSALDAVTEQLVQDNLLALLDGKTVLVVAHRLTTLKQLDRIIVLDHGCIVESGRHEDLLRKEGLYATLWRHQSNGFIGDA